MQKIVARYRDGRIIKGHTSNFAPGVHFFHVTPPDAPSGSEPQVIETAQLKAVFFVRTFEGNPGRDDRQHFVEHQPYQGRHIEVTFADGEVMVGATPSYGADMPGFFIFPADTESNTLKVYAVASAVRKVHFVDPQPPDGGVRSGNDRRSGEDRRKEQLPFDGPDKRSGEERRSGRDRRRGLLRWW